MNSAAVKAVRKPAAKKAPAARKPPARKVAADAAKVVEKVETVKPDKPAKAPKPPKVVRDSFTMPATDFAIIDRIKLRAIEWNHPVKKSEVLRAGLKALEALSDAKVRVLLEGLDPIKKGRPKSA
jgi:hypothetical protein